MLDELRKKPRSLKEAYALWGAVGMTALVALVWTVSLPVRFSDTGALEISGETQGAGAFSQFVDQIKTNVSATWNQGKAAVGGLNSTSTDQATSTSDSSVSGTTTPSTSGPGIIVGTSSSPAVKVGTSSSESR